MKALIVDGYNAINKIPRLRKVMDGGLQDAREVVTELAREYKRRCGGFAKLYVVFDGRDEHRNKPYSAHSEQVFSATGQGDREIIKLVKKLHRQYHVIVASDDNFVRNNSRAHGATVITISDFYTSASKRHSSRKKTRLSEIDQDWASDINEELKRHWGL